MNVCHSVCVCVCVCVAVHSNLIIIIVSCQGCSPHTYHASRHTQFDTMLTPMSCKLWRVCGVCVCERDRERERERERGTGRAASLLTTNVTSRS